MNLSDDLCNNLLNKNYDDFWKNWNHLNGKVDVCSSMIDGCIDKQQIADTFAESFRKIYSGSTANDKLRSDFLTEFASYSSEKIALPISPHLFSWDDIFDTAFSIKVGKATSTFVKAEHIFYGCPELLCCIHLLFDAL